MNKDVIKGKWKEIKGDLRKAWGHISDEEWEKTKGDVAAIAGILQQKYGFAKTEASEKVAKFMQKYTSATRDNLERQERKDKLN